MKYLLRMYSRMYISYVTPRDSKKRIALIKSDNISECKPCRHNRNFYKSYSEYTARKYDLNLYKLLHHASHIAIQCSDHDTIPK